MRAPPLVAALLGLALSACDDTGGTVGPGLADVTYHADVRPIFESSCASCHSEGNIGPFSVAYDAGAWADGAPWWAAPSAASVAAGTMPPWSPDEDCRPILDSRALSDEDKDVVAAWAALGFPEGDPADFVPRGEEEAVVEVRTLDRPPELVLQPEAAYTADPSRPDDYHCFVLDADFAEDAWVEGVSVEPDRLELVHHVILYRVPPDEVDQLEALDAAEDGPGYTCYGSAGTDTPDTVAGWAPGQQPEVYPEGIARRIEAGSKLVMQVHYNTLNLAGGESVPQDRSGVSLWTLPSGEEPERQLASFPFLDTSIVLPPGDPDIVHTSSTDLSWVPLPIEVMGAFPHMHQLGTRIKATYRPPLGPEACLIDIPTWDFDWQQSYFYDPVDYLEIIRGEVRVECAYDNSTANQPVVNGEQLEPREVTWGDGTLDEMCLVYLHVLVPPGLL